MKHNILYSFRRCPYAMRARWALIRTNQCFLLREIELKKKHPLFLITSSKGTVPVLKTNKGNVIEESLDIMRWAINRSNKLDLLANGDQQKAKIISTLIQKNDIDFKYHLDRFKYSSRYDINLRAKHKSSAMQILLSWNKEIALSHKFGSPGFLVCNHETIADWAIWPFVRQFRIIDKDDFDQNKDLLYLQRWLNYFSSQKAYEITMKKHARWELNSKKIFINGTKI